MISGTLLMVYLPIGYSGLDRARSCSGDNVTLMRGLALLLLVEMGELKADPFAFPGALLLLEFGRRTRDLRAADRIIKLLPKFSIIIKFRGVKKFFKNIFMSQSM